MDSSKVLEKMRPSPLVDNGPHYLPIQLRKLALQLNRSVPLSLCSESSHFGHMKQGNGLNPYMACLLSNDDGDYKCILNIWMYVFWIFKI